MKTNKLKIRQSTIFVPIKIINYLNIHYIRQLVRHLNLLLIISINHYK